MISISLFRRATATRQLFGKRFRFSKTKIFPLARLCTVTQRFPSLNLSSLKSTEAEIPLPPKEDERLVALNQNLKKLFHQNNIVQMFEECRQAKLQGVKINEATFTWLLLAYGRSGKPDQCYQVFQDMQAMGFRPSPIAYDIVLRSFTYSNDVKKAMLVFEEMKKNEIMRSNATYIHLLRICNRSKSIQPGLLVWQDFESQTEVIADKLLYTELIKLAMNAQNAEMAVEIVRKCYLVRKIELPSSVLETVLDACLGSEHGPGIAFLYDVISYHAATTDARFGPRRSPGARPPTIGDPKNIGKYLTEGELLRMLERVGGTTQFRFAEELYQKIVEKFGQNNFHLLAFNSLLCCYAQGKMVKTIFERLNQRPPNSDFSLHRAVISHVANALPKIELIEKHYEYLLELHNQGQQVHLDCLNIIIRACSKVKMISRSKEILLSVPQFNLAPSPMTIECFALGALHDVSSAPIVYEVFAYCEANSWHGTPLAYEQIIRCLLDGGQVDWCIDTLKYSRSHATPTFSTYLLLLNHFRGSGDRRYLRLLYKFIKDDGWAEHSLKRLGIPLNFNFNE